MTIIDTALENREKGIGGMNEMESENMGEPGRPEPNTTSGDATLSLTIQGTKNITFFVSQKNLQESVLGMNYLITTYRRKLKDI